MKRITIRVELEIEGATPDAVEACSWLTGRWMPASGVVIREARLLAEDRDDGRGLVASS